MTASYEIYKTRFDNYPYVCAFMIDGHVDSGASRTSGTGIKLYESKEKAEAAGKRYLKKMKANGFEV